MVNVIISDMGLDMDMDVDLHVPLSAELRRRAACGVVAARYAVVSRLMPGRAEIMRHPQLRDAADVA